MTQIVKLIIDQWENLLLLNGEITIYWNDDGF